MKKKMGSYLFILVFGPFIMGIIVQELSLCPFEFEHGIFFGWLDGVMALAILYAFGAFVYLIKLFFKK